MKIFSRKKPATAYLSAMCGVLGAALCTLSMAGPAQADGMFDEIGDFDYEERRQDIVVVPIDNSTMVELERNAATIVVGNPSIAEVSVQKGNLLFVLGRNFGTTNVIALDSNNKQIADIPVSVTTTMPHHMTLYRGAGQSSFTCAPRCERSLIPGDFGEEYSTAESQVRSKLSIGKDASGQR